MKILLCIIISVNLHAATIAPTTISAPNPREYVDKDGDAIIVLDADARYILHPSKEVKTPQSNAKDAAADKTKQEPNKIILKDKKTE